MRALRRLALAAALGLAAAAPAAAQEAPPDPAAWEALAGRAEAALEGGAGEDAALAALRAEIVARREAFLDAQDINAARIATLQGQIAALGAPPETGEEPPEIAARRADLETGLARLRAPRQRAEEAFARASGLIAEIDRTLRARHARMLFERGPSPLHPARWPPALAALGETLGALAAEPRAILAEAPRARLPAILVLLVVGAGLIARARGWMRPLMRRAEAGLPPSAQGVAVLALSAGQVVLPLLGAGAIGAAAALSGALGPLGIAAVSGLGGAALHYFSARWIASWVFPVGDRWNLTLGLPARARAEGRAHAALLGAVLAVGAFAAPLAQATGWSAQTRDVLAFPLLLALGLMLARLGQLLARHAGHAPPPAEGGEAAAPEAGSDGVAGPLLRNTGRAAMAVGVLGPALAALGYGRAGDALLIPAVLSLGVIGLVVVLQQLIRDLYALVSRRDDGAGDALLPALVGLGLTLAALPVLALIWGARASDLTEVWARVRAGARIGETVISPGAVVSFALILGVGIVLTRIVQRALRAQVLPRTRLDPGGRTAIVSGVGYAGFVVAALAAITGAGIDLSALAIVAGALSVGIGFGLQNVVNNFVSGIILLIERPIAEGDWIEVGGRQGTVRRISVRSTRIETFDRTDVIVPNADLIAGTVTNWTHGNLIGRLILPVGVAYGSDSRQVERVLREIAEAHPMVVLKPPPSILFRRFGADALEFEVRAILRDVNWLLSVETDLNHAIARRFAEERIEIPFAQRDVWLRNPEALRRASEPPGGAAGATEAPAHEPRPLPPDLGRWAARRDDAATG